MASTVKNNRGMSNRPFKCGLMVDMPAQGQRKAFGTRVYYTRLSGT